MIVLRYSSLAAVAAVGVFGGVALSSALGYWNVESTKVPAAIKSGEFAGMPSPSDIRGSYSWNDVAKAFALPVGDLTRAFGASDAGQRVSILEDIWAGKLAEGLEVGTDSVRLFVSLYTGLPHEGEEGTVLPETAVAVLRGAGKGDPERLAEAAARAVPAAGPAAGPAMTAGSAAEHTEAKPAGTIVGKTTFADLRSWGFDMEKVRSLLGGLGKDGETVRDYCAAQGLEFSSVKTALQEMAPR